MKKGRDDCTCDFFLVWGAHQVKCDSLHDSKAFQCDIAQLYLTHEHFVSKEELNLITKFFIIGDASVRDTESDAAERISAHIKYRREEGVPGHPEY